VSAVPTIEDELRTVFEEYASREPTVERRAAIQHRIERRHRRRLTAGAIAIVAVIAGTAAGVTFGGHGSNGAANRPTSPTVVITPKLTGPVRCDGSTGEPVLRALFATIDAGRHVNLGTYFVAPLAFNLWWDPLVMPGSAITFMPGPGSGTVNLDALQTHLDKLSSSHLQITVSSFTARGFTSQDYDGGPPGGGEFEFTTRRGVPPNGSSGVGAGLVDCVTGKLKAIVIDQW